MTNIAIHKQNENRPTALAERTSDPLRTLRSLLSWDPFGEMAPFRAFDERAFAITPAFDVKETKEAYEFRADVPGIQDKDLEVTMTGNRLTISGKREAEKEDKSDRYYTFERSSGSFSRSLRCLTARIRKSCAPRSRRACWPSPCRRSPRCKQRRLRSRPKARQASPEAHSTVAAPRASEGVDLLAENGHRWNQYLCLNVLAAASLSLSAELATSAPRHASASRDGAHVVVADVIDDDGERVAERIRRADGRALFTPGRI